MVRVYKVSPENVQSERRRLATAVIILCVMLPLSIGLIALCFHLDPHSLTTHDYLSVIVGLGMPCAALWLCTLTLPSLKIELEDDRITKTQERPLWGTPLKVSFSRDDVSHIREVGKSGLMIRGRGRNGRYIDLHIPRLVENYDELKTSLATWQPVQNSWI
jgi:hypothetical protein